MIVSTLKRIKKVHYTNVHFCTRLQVMHFVVCYMTQGNI